MNRPMHVRMPAETAVAIRNGRTRRKVQRLIDVKVATPEERRVSMLDRHARTVVLVGCGKAKGEEPAAARDLYTSAMFRKSIELAELVGDAAFVASAAKVLIGLDERVTPYDRELKSWPRWARSEWGENVVRELERRTLGSPSRIRVVLLMGCTYADPIIAAVRSIGHGNTRWAEPVDLLRGLQIGERLAFLNLALAALAQGGEVRGLSRRLLDTSTPRV